MSDDSPFRGSLNRRSAIRLGVAGAATILATPGLAASHRPLEPNDPEDARIIYRKLRYRADSGMLFSWIKGPYMASIDGTLVPMYGINLGAISRVTQRPDGGFDLVDLEISFRVDVETGLRLTDFRNPITNETVPVVVKPQGPNRLIVTRDNDVQIENIAGGPKFEMTHVAPRPFVLGNEVFIRDRSHVRVTMPDGAVAMLNEVSTISAARADVLDRSKSTVVTRVQSNDVRSWPAWLNMGNRPGTLSLFGNGAKVSRFTDLPEDWREMLQETAPDIAKDPAGALDRPAQFKPS